MRIYMGSPKSEILGRGGATVRSGDILYLKSSQTCVVRDDEAGAEGHKSAFGGFALLDDQNLVDFGTRLRTLHLKNSPPDYFS